MYDLDPGVREGFVGGESRATRGARSLLEGFTLDDHHFDPSGYSLNGIRGDRYFTVHVTPQLEGSYVSFETNFDFRQNPDALVQRVVDIFRPESFDVFAFLPNQEPLSVDIDGFTLFKHVYQDVVGYGVSFQHFFRPPHGSVAAKNIPLA